MALAPLCAGVAGAGRGAAATGQRVTRACGFQAILGRRPRGHRSVHRHHAGDPDPRRRGHVGPLRTLSHPLRVADVLRGGSGASGRPTAAHRTPGTAPEDSQAPPGAPQASHGAAGTLFPQSVSPNRGPVIVNAAFANSRRRRGQAEGFPPAARRNLVGGTRGGTWRRGRRRRRGACEYGPDPVRVWTARRPGIEQTTIPHGRTLSPSKCHRHQRAEMGRGAGWQGGPSCNRIVRRTLFKYGWHDPTPTERNTYRTAERCRPQPCRRPRRPTLAGMVTQAGSVQGGGGSRVFQIAPDP